MVTQYRCWRRFFAVGLRGLVVVLAIGAVCVEVRAQRGAYLDPKPGGSTSDADGDGFQDRFESYDEQEYIDGVKNLLRKPKAANRGDRECRRAKAALMAVINERAARYGGVGWVSGYDRDDVQRMSCAEAKLAASAWTDFKYDSEIEWERRRAVSGLYDDFGGDPSGVERVARGVPSSSAQQGLEAMRQQREQAREQAQAAAARGDTETQQALERLTRIYDDAIQKAQSRVGQRSDGNKRFVTPPRVPANVERTPPPVPDVDPLAEFNDPEEQRRRKQREGVDALDGLFSNGSSALGNVEPVTADVASMDRFSDQSHAETPRKALDRFSVHREAHASSADLDRFNSPAPTPPNLDPAVHIPNGASRRGRAASGAAAVVAEAARAFQISYESSARNAEVLKRVDDVDQQSKVGGTIIVFRHITETPDPSLGRSRHDVVDSRFIVGPDPVENVAKYYVNDQNDSQFIRHNAVEVYHVGPRSLADTRTPEERTQRVLLPQIRAALSLAEQGEPAIEMHRARRQELQDSLRMSP